MRGRRVTARRRIKMAAPGFTALSWQTCHSPPVSRRLSSAAATRRSMFPVTHLLVACAALISQLHAALGSCNSDSMGELKGREVPLAPTPLEPGQPYWTIAIPRVNNCDVQGVVVTCCDDEVLPEIKIQNMKTAFVERKGQLLIPAIVTASVYCRDGWSSAPALAAAPHYPHLSPMPRL